MRGLRIAAVVVSLLLGVIGGLATAQLTGDDDPLHLGISRVDQPCSGRSILLIGRGDTRAALRSSIVNSPDGARAHYLAVAESCATMYSTAEEGADDPAYVVYLGPYESATAACQARMSADHLRDTVTRLAYGNEIYVKCPCELSTASMPTLTPGMVPSAVETAWIKQLQGMLSDIGRLPPTVHGSGQYDLATQAKVRQMQGYYGLTRDGVVGQTMWDHLTQRACKNYDY